MFVDASQPWPKNAWYHAAWSNEIEDKPFARTLLNEGVVLFRDKDGWIWQEATEVGRRMEKLGRIVAWGRLLSPAVKVTLHTCGMRFVFPK